MANTQREHDDESGLCYFRARTYDPASGRFLQKDPITDLAIKESYVYSQNVPTRFTDPKGTYVVLDHEDYDEWDLWYHEEEDPRKYIEDYLEDLYGGWWIASGRVLNVYRRAKPLKGNMPDRVRRVALTPEEDMTIEEFLTLVGEESGWLGMPAKAKNELMPIYNERIAGETIQKLVDGRPVIVEVLTMCDGGIDDMYHSAIRIGDVVLELYDPPNRGKAYAQVLFSSWEHVKKRTKAQGRNIAAHRIPFNRKSALAMLRRESGAAGMKWDYNAIGRSCAYYVQSILREISGIRFHFMECTPGGYF